jgi:phospholipase/carboxylesterase
MNNVESGLTTFEDWTLRLRPPSGGSGRVLLMLHGWTGDENSMWAFARDLPATDWLIAPRAPYLAPSGYSWRATHQGWPGFDDLQPSAARLLDLLDRWGIANGVATSQVDLIGFSQGAAMCVTFSLVYPSRIGRLALLAGFAPPGADHFIADRPLAGKSVFVAHGLQDERVPVEYARFTVQFLESCGASVSYCESETGHKVGAECRRELADFFRE